MSRGPMLWIMLVVGCAMAFLGHRGERALERLVCERATGRCVYFDRGIFSTERREFAIADVEAVGVELTPGRRRSGPHGTPWIRLKNGDQIELSSTGEEAAQHRGDEMSRFFTAGQEATLFDEVSGDHTTTTMGKWAGVVLALLAAGALLIDRRRPTQPRDVLYSTGDPDAQ